MSPSHSTKGNRRYRYYVCTRAQKRGWHSCSSKSIPAGEIERFVVEQIKRIGQDSRLVQEVVRQAGQQSGSELDALETERGRLERELSRSSAEVAKLVREPAGRGHDAHLADLNERIRLAERRVAEIREQTLALSKIMLDQREVQRVMTLFEPVWDSLSPREQTRVIQILVERVDYDGANGNVAITFSPVCIRLLSGEFNDNKQDDAA
jgi:site-specific DNA recombinase